MQSTPALDSAGRPPVASAPPASNGRAPRNKGVRYPPDSPTVDEIVAVVRATGAGPEGVRLRGIIVVLWRAGLRIKEALALNETDLDHDRGSLVVRRGKGDKRREVAMDRWAWTHLDPWLELRRELSVGRLFCVVRGPTRGRPCAARNPVTTARHRGNSRRPTPVRAAPAPARPRSRDVPRRDLPARHPAPARACRPGQTSRYLRAIDNTEIIAAVHQRPAPMIPADPQTTARR